MGDGDPAGAGGWKMSGRALLCGVVLLAITAPAVAQQRPGRDALGAGPARNARAARMPEVASITAKLSGEKETFAEAIAEIDRFVETQPAQAASYLRSSWLNSLLAAGFYEDVERLSLISIAELAYDTAAVEQIQRLRIKAFLARGKVNEGLAAAKGLFNVASLAGTKSAVLQVAECLSAAHPEDSSIVNHFRREQLAGAATQPTGTEPPTQPASQPASTQPAGVLQSIRIDPAPFAEALKRYDTSRYTIESNPFRSRVARGNLLLLCDRADEARAAFEEAAQVAAPDESAPAMENTARAIKAQTGTIGPANAWMK